MTKAANNHNRPHRGRRGAAGRNAAAETKQGRGKANANPQANLKRYMDLAHEAAAAGDAVQSEYYQQYADHYRRLIAQG